jgi:riboflavin kinase
VFLYSSRRHIANLPEGSITKLCESLEVGVYYGWAQLEGDIVRAMVMSLGWNPYYKNEKRSAVCNISPRWNISAYRELIDIGM